MDMLEHKCFICGPTIYQHIQEASIGKELDCCHKVNSLVMQHSCWALVKKALKYFLVVYKEKWYDFMP